MLMPTIAVAGSSTSSDVTLDGDVSGVINGAVVTERSNSLHIRANFQHESPLTFKINPPFPDDPLSYPASGEDFEVRLNTRNGRAGFLYRWTADGTGYRLEASGSGEGGSEVYSFTFDEAQIYELVLNKRGKQRFKPIWVPLNSR